MSNPAMIALIGANPGLTAISTYGGGSYPGRYKSLRNSKQVPHTPDKLLLILALLLFLLPTMIIVLIVLEDTVQLDWKDELVIMQQKCVDRGGKLVYAKFAGDICVIDIDKPINKQ